MKKYFMSYLGCLLVTSVGFSNNNPIKNKNVKETKKEIVQPTQKNKKEDVCTITCSVTENGVTYTASAGNWFTSCNTAGNQCIIKLGKILTPGM